MIYIVTLPAADPNISLSNLSSASYKIRVCKAFVISSELKMKRSGDTHVKGGDSKLTIDDALAYIKSVKDTFQDAHKFNGFLQLFKDFQDKKKTIQDFVSSSRDLFKGYPGLITGLNNFLPSCFKAIQAEPDAPRSPPRKKHKQKEQQQQQLIDPVNFINKIETTDPVIYVRFLQILDTYCKNTISISEVYHQVSRLFLRHPELIEDFRTFLPHPSVVTTATTLRLWRPTHRSEIKENNPSYKVCKVASTSPSRDKLNPSHKVSQKSPQVAVRYHTNDEYGEDDLFELDMLVESVKAANRSALISQVKICRGTILHGTSFHVREHFTALNLRCLQRIYKEEMWPIVKRRLCKNPKSVLPVILARLGQKEEELKQFVKKFRSEFRIKIGERSLGHPNSTCK